MSKKDKRLESLTLENELLKAAIAANQVAISLQNDTIQYYESVLSALIGPQPEQSESQL